MKLLLTLLVAMLFLIPFNGCDKKCSQLNVCRLAGSSTKIIGYYAQDVDTQIFLFYKPNGLFDQRVDSGSHINTDVAGGYIYNQTDTQYFDLFITGSTMSSQRVDDVRVILPGVRTYNLTEIMVDGDYTEVDEFTCSTGSYGCSRHVVSLKVDGVYNDLSKNDLILYK